MIIVFALRVVTPGDPVDQIAPTNSFTEEQREEVREEFGLNKPIPVQFLDYVVGVFTGDLGDSYITREPVLDSMLKRLPVSLTICLGAVLIGLIAVFAVNLHWLPAFMFTIINSNFPH